MPDNTTIQSLPLIQPSQAQKHVTHNEALKILDLIVQMTAISRTVSAPPATPANGDSYIVAVGASGAWAGQVGNVANFTGIAWEFHPPKTGWTAWVEDEGEHVVWTGSAWASPAESPATFAELGVNTTADATNRLAVRAPATLLTHEGAGHQLKVNKAAAGDTASLLFQTGFSGRAEMGTAGNDDFSIKVSPDGATFTEAVSFDRTTGRTRVQKGLRLTPAAGDIAGPADGEMWYDSTTGKFRARQNGASVDVIQAASGTSTFSDATFTLQDDIDPTKQARFQLSSLTAGQTRTYTLPDTTGTLVLNNQATTTLGSTTATATLNIGAGVTVSGGTKTLNLGTAAASGATTNIAIGSAVAGSLGTTTFNSPTVAFGATVTAINLPDAATFLTDNLDPAKRAQFEISAITSGTTRTVTLPNASGQMVLDSASQTLTNKAINLNSNTITGTLPASSVAMTGGGTAQDYAGFSTRAAFVTWASGKTPAVGAIIDAAGYSYRFIGTGTAISDLPGWVPLGQAFPDHWAQNLVPGTTDMLAALTAALAYSATVYMSGGIYAVTNTLAWNNATLIGNNDRGTARTQIRGLAASIPVGNAIIAPGRSATVRGIQVGYDTLTGTETQFQRVGLDTRGLGQNLQRGSVIDEVVFDNVGTAISDFGEGEFSVTYGTLEIVKHSYRGVDIRGVNRTGSVWLNLYINGGDVYTPEGGFCITGQGAGGFVGQLNIEHGPYSGYPVRLEGLQGLSINSLHIEGVDVTTADRAYLGLDSASVTVQSLNVLNTRMSADNTAVVRMARGAYQSTAVGTPLTTASTTSVLKVGKLHLKGLAAPSNSIYPAYPTARTGVRNCPGFAVFRRDAAFTDQNWLVEVDDYLWGLYTAQAADRSLVEFPETTAVGAIQFRRFGDRGGNIVPFDNYVQNGAFDKWLTTTATVTSGATEVANRWTLRGTTGSVTVDRVQDSYGALGQFGARVTVGTAGTGQSWDQDLAFPVEWIGQTLRLTFEMRAATAGRVLEQITANLINTGGSPASVTKQVISGTDTRIDAGTTFRTYVIDFTAVDGASITTLGSSAVMRLSFQFNNTTASRAPVVTFRKVALSKVAGEKFPRNAYDRLSLTSTDVAGLGALATASAVNLTSQAAGTLQAAQAPALTGDVTSAAGSLATTIAAGAVGNAKLATMAANTVKANATAAAAAPTDVAIGASQLFGRGATGDLAPITLGTNLSMSGTTLNATGGGGGAPGGATGQMQFNSAGSFAGASEILVENNQLRLPTATSFAAPAAGGVRLIGRADAGRTLPAFLAQDGLPREMQVALTRSSPLIWKAQSTQTTFSVIGGNGPTAVGTATAASIAATNLVTYTPRLEFLVTTAATTAVAGFRGVAPIVSVGGASANLGGFSFVGRWGPATGVATTTNRAFFGLANVTSAPTDVEPSTTINCIAMGWDAADANIQIMVNDATGTCTKTDLGATFAVPTTDRSALYELALFSPKGTTQSVAWMVTDLVTGATASGTVTTDLPSTTTLLAPRGWMSVGGTSSVIGIGVNTIYLDPLL